MSSVEERFSTALHHAARGWRQAIDRRLKHLGMSQASWMAVAVAAKAEAPLAQIELANRVGVEGATMVATLDRLEKAALIERTPSATDRRVKLVVLTPAGLQLHAKVRREADSVRKHLLSGIDPKLLLLATELLEGVHAVMETSP